MEGWKMAELASISPSASFLQQISDVKRQIDQINEEIEAEIKKTKELETEILRVSDREQQAIQERGQWKKVLIRKEVQHMDLEAVTAATKESIAEAEENLELTRNRREELYNQIQDERDSFIETCKIFQLHQQDAAEDESELKLVERKCNLLTELTAFRKKYEALKVTDEVFSQNKVNKLRELQTVNDGIQAELNEENAHNQKLLKRIEGLDTTYLTVRASEDFARLQAELENFTEEKRNLEDGILTLQQQLPILLNHEQKLGELLKEQQQVLQSLERKLQEVKALQEAYEKDARNESELPPMPQRHTSKGNVVIRTLTRLLRKKRIENHLTESSTEFPVSHTHMCSLNSLPELKGSGNRLRFMEPRGTDDDDNGHHLKCCGNNWMYYKYDCLDWSYNTCNCHAQHKFDEYIGQPKSK